MKAMIMKTSGDPRDVLMLSNVPELHPPAADEVIVRVNKRLVHPADIAAIRAFLPAALFAPDGIPGVDGVGIIEAVGMDVDPATGVTVGARVVLLSSRKSWAERVVVSAIRVQPVPNDIDDDVACLLATDGSTAAMLLHAAEQASAEASDADAPFLLTAAGSGVASIMIALCALRGRPVIGLVRHDANAAAVADRFPGLTVMGTDRPDWQAAINAAAGHPIWVALDPIGGEMMPKLLDSVADGGTVIVYGGLDPNPSLISSGTLTGRELTIRGMSAFGWPERTPAEQRAADFDALFDIARRMPQIFEGSRIFPLSEAVSAIANAEQSPRRGATILVTDP